MNTKGGLKYFMNDCRKEEKKNKLRYSKKGNVTIKHNSL